MESVDMISQNVEKIGSLFPNCITEIAGKDGRLKKVVDFDKLKQMLSSDNGGGTTEHYEFTWVGKRASIAEANKPIRKTLRPCKEESKNWDTTENLYIEGDNLDVLKLLQESYLGKVKMIYIDPPYNTGNDFIYKDDFSQTVEEYEQAKGTFDDEGNRLFKNSDTNGRFHSDWCSMIYPRLMLARNLLTDDGVIFISIDDSEQENLKKICDEIFGEKNFVSQLVWEKKKKGSFLSKNYINMKEYILVYAKINTLFKGLIGEIVNEKETYPCIKTTNKDGIRIIRKGIVSKYKKKNYIISAGTCISAGNMKLTYLDEAIVNNNILQNDVRVYSNWIYNQNSLDKYTSENSLYITQDNYIRRVVKETRIKMLKDLLTRVGDDGEAVSKFIFDINLNNGGWGTNEDANEELHQILNQQYIFNYSKPVRLLAKLIQTISDKDDLVLDFFSGSATTAHAVMQLNAEDGGKRKFIMVQLPEKTDEKSEAFKAGYENICEIGKERIRRAGEKIKAEAGLNGENLDIGFRVFKLDSTNMNDVYYSAGEYNQQMLENLESNIKADRTDMDLLFGCLLDWGLPLSLPYVSEQIDGFTVHTYNEGDLIACFAENVSEKVIEEIARRRPLRVIFRDNSFADSPAKINVWERFKLLAPDTQVKVI